MFFRGDFLFVENFGVLNQFIYIYLAATKIIGVRAHRFLILQTGNRSKWKCKSLMQVFDLEAGNAEIAAEREALSPSRICAQPLYICSGPSRSVYWG